LTGILPGTIIPWLLGGLILLLLFSVTVSVKSWREAKRSPYYFLRVQAAKKMQSYLSGSALLAVLLLVAGVYAWQAPSDTVTRLAVLRNAKPTASTSGEAALDLEVIAEASPEIVTINLSDDNLNISPSIADSVDLSVQDEKTDGVSDEGVKVAQSSEIGGIGPIIGSIYFSTDINSNYQPVDPGSQFAQGYFTLYATFSYESMDDGITWSWLWKRNGQVIEGGDQVWSYGSDGPGYVYLRPEEGFQLGEHSLEVWVEDKLMSQSGFTITEGVSASN
jgi:hypothetical protein